MDVRVRVAPSPTGNLHIGTAQSAIYNWLFARATGGKFFLRIEDTDKARSTKEFEENILDGLSWLGLDWDDAPRHSSDNNKRYGELLEKLLEEGKAFYCHHSKEELETERQKQESDKELPRHICNHKKTEEGTKPGGIVRLMVDEKSERVISFEDQIRGHVEFRQALLGDFSIGRAADDALYHFAVVVDDAEMQITHVLRGEDHISNTPKHILIFEALGYPVPLFAHLPLILAPDRSKLSKRHGATAVMDYKKDYLPEALFNFLGNLGYTFSKEIMTKEEMSSGFELSKIHRSGAVFDVKKLDWLNGEYINNVSDDKLIEKLEQHLPENFDKGYLEKFLPMVRERIKKFSDVKEFDFFFSETEYGPELLVWKTRSKEEISHSLRSVIDKIEKFSENIDKDELRKELDGLASEIGDRGLVYWPFRVALTGRKSSPDPVDIAWALGKTKTLERVNKAISKIQ